MRIVLSMPAWIVSRGLGSAAPWTREHPSFVVKIAGLVGGFAAGQGAVFAVQTWLLSQGQLSTVADYGFAFGILSLAQWTADWGGLILFARYVMAGEACRVWPAIWVRLVLSLFAGQIIIWIALAYMPQPFGRGILLGGALIAPLWSFNLSGFFDGHGKNAANGVIAGLPWLASAITTFALFTSGHAASAATGILIGLSYCCGCAVCVILQHVIARLMWHGDAEAGGAGRRHAWEFFRDGLVYCSGEFPNQFYGRALIGIVSSSLGPEITGVYVYIRQILIGFAQIITFVRRAELPRLAPVLVGPVKFGALCRAQSASLGLAFAIFATSGLLFAARQSLPPRMEEIAFYSLFFSAVLPIWALSASYGQVLVLQAQMRSYSVILLSTIGCSAMLTSHFTNTFGLTFVAICEFTMYSLQTVWFISRVSAR